MRISAIGQQTTTFRECSDCQKCPKCQPQPTPHKHKTNPFTLTGWIGAAGVATAVLGGIFHQKNLHKAGAYIGAIATGAHISMAIGHKHCHNHHKDIVA